MVATFLMLYCCCAGAVLLLYCCFTDALLRLAFFIIGGKGGQLIFVPGPI
jgi:hypothetical protein